MAGEAAGALEALGRVEAGMVGGGIEWGKIKGTQSGRVHSPVPPRDQNPKGEKGID